MKDLKNGINAGKTDVAMLWYFAEKIEDYCRTVD